MAGQRFARWLMNQADGSGRWDPLVGDLLEEIDSGRRSPLWVWQQVVGSWRVVLLTRVRDRLRVTPHLVALTLGMVFLAGTSITSLGTVVEGWLTFYLVCGTVSLFGHIMSRTTGARGQLTSADSK
jgi:hypothetical protein